MTPFRATLALSRAEEILSRPPAIARIVRPSPRGELVARFALPLELCLTTNRTRGAAAWAHQAVKARLASMMWAQCRPRRVPLPGRPQVLCVRFSSSEPDAYSDWAKAAIDVLCVPKARAPNRLGLIVDDNPEAADVVQWWEPAKAREGFVMLEVWTGTP